MTKVKWWAYEWEYSRGENEANYPPRLFYSLSLSLLLFNTQHLWFFQRRWFLNY
jgi:hypothetical protein